MYVAHLSDDGRVESVREHLVAVSEMAAGFSRDFDSGEFGRMLGLAHDIGKYSDGFQKRILANGPRVDHSTAGAYLLDNAGLRDTGALLAYCVAGHHGGLPDGGSASDNEELPSLQARLKHASSSDRTWLRRATSEGFELTAPPTSDILQRSANDPFALAFWTRMMFSCLVDADFLCTETFVQGQPRERLDSPDFANLAQTFEESIARFFPPEGRLNEVRCEIMNACLEAASGKPGFYSLTVPTGGGKTLASMRFALHHAAREDNRVRRIIYAIPYTSIIEQNAEVFRERLGAENILEHHSGFDFDADENDQGDPTETARSRERMRLASENWEAPIVVTTNVQLFDSLFANRSSKCRKLHNIANSVIILDEAQMLPIERLEPCLHALRTLVNDYGCTVVFCTATQPALSGLVEGLEDVREICPDVSRTFADLTRVSYEYAGALSDEQLADALTSHDQALCIVNSRAQAKALFDLLKERKVEAFHLSTLMHLEHRNRIIREVRERLESGGPCCVISTSLIEAGVDLDFPVVFRGMAGLDSIVQAGGRCNREGRRDPRESRVIAFDAETPYRIPAETKQRASIARSVLRANGFFEQPVSESSSTRALESPLYIDEYFAKLYALRKEGMDKDDVYRNLSTCDVRAIPFRETADLFHMIDDPSHTIVVPCEEIEEELGVLRSGHGDRRTMRKLSRYSVKVYSWALQELLESGIVEPLCESAYVLRNPERYSQDSGLDFGPMRGEGLMF